MGKQELKYDAFISYRHSELDKFVAETLHRELENFSLPKSAVKKLERKEVQKTRITRVFRDRDELPIASNLADPIVQALQASDFLILICTPRLLESIWCKTEIETFIKMHGRKKVLAVLAEGEPSDSFPQEILWDENQKPVEPLAADVRGKSKREIRKKIKEEILRLAAPMFSCAYDELKQRHRERKLKRIITAASAGAAVCFAFGSISTAMALRIRTQSLEIEKQAVKIEQQYSEAMKTNAKAMAEDARRLLAKGDRIGAINTAVSALPHKNENAQMPYTPQAQYALTESLYVYENGYQILPIHILEQEAEIAFIKLSPQKDRVLVVDVYGNICVWDAMTRQKIIELNDNNANFGLSEGQADFLNNDLIIYAEDNGFAVYDAANNKQVIKKEDCAVGKILVSSRGDTFAVFGYSGIKVFQSKDATQIYQYELEDNQNILYTAAFNETGTELAFAIEGKAENDQAMIQIQVMDFLSGTAKQINQLYDVTLQQILLTEEKIYTIVYKEETAENEILPKYKSAIYCNDAKLPEKIVWEYQYEKGIINELKMMQGNMDKYLVFIGYGYLGVIEKETGMKMDECEYGQTLVDFDQYGESSLIGIMLRNGEYHFLDTEKKLDMVQNNKFMTSSNNIKKFFKGKEFFVSLEYGSTSITVYSTVLGKDARILYKGDSYIPEVKLASDQKTAIILQGNVLGIYDVVKNVMINSIDFKENLMGASFLEEDENTVLAVLPSKLIYCTIQDGKWKKQMVPQEALYDLKIFLKGGSEVGLYSTNQIKIMDAHTGDIKEILETEEDINVLDAYAIGDESHWYAVAAKSSKYLKIYQRGHKENIKKIALNTACVSYLNFSDADEKIYVTYIDGKVEVYDVKNGTLLNTYTEFENEVKRVQTDKNNNLTYLFTDEEGYAVNVDGDVIARIDSLKAVLSSQNQYIISNMKTLYTVPIYDLEDLINEADKQR